MRPEASRKVYAFGGYFHEGPPRQTSNGVLKAYFRFTESKKNAGFGQFHISAILPDS